MSNLFVALIRFGEGYLSLVFWRFKLGIAIIGSTAWNAVRCEIDYVFLVPATHPLTKLDGLWVDALFYSIPPCGLRYWDMVENVF